MPSESLKLAKLEARREAIGKTLEVAREAVRNPVLVGLSGLLINRAVYQAGFYKPKAGEQVTSVLGGPVWWTIGNPLPAEQELYQKINLFIVTASTAWAFSGASGALTSLTGLLGKLA